MIRLTRLMLPSLLCAGLVLALPLAIAPVVSAQDEEGAPDEAAKPAKKPSRFKGDELFAPPSAEDARNRVVEAVATRGVKDPAILEQIGKLWTFGEDEPVARVLLDKVASTAALIDPKAAEFVAACRALGEPDKIPNPEFLNSAEADDFFALQLRLFYGRFLAEHRMYDEGLTVLEGLDPKKLVDPATCLFYSAVCQHQLLLKDEALLSLKLLTKNTESVPPTYSAVASLMQLELEGLNPKTLGHIARKMSDSERRLDLGRAGERVQKVQGEIIAELDEIIERMEQQAGGGGGGGGGSDGQGKSNQPSSAAEDSRVKGTTGKGDVDQKALGQKGNWGSLNDKQQAQAKNLIGRKFPAHYRQAVEEYFKKLANRPAGAGK